MKIIIEEHGVSFDIRGQGDDGRTICSSLEETLENGLKDWCQRVRKFRFKELNEKEKKFFEKFEKEINKE